MVNLCLAIKGDNPSRIKHCYRVLQNNSGITYREMATTDGIEYMSKDAGKAIITGPEITSVADLKLTHSNKTIEAKVYRKWVTKTIQTRHPRGFCCILIKITGSRHSS